MERVISCFSNVLASLTRETRANALPAATGAPRSSFRHPGLGTDEPVVRLRPSPPPNTWHLPLRWLRQEASAHGLSCVAETPATPGHVTSGPRAVVTVRLYSTKGALGRSSSEDTVNRLKAAMRKLVRRKPVAPESADIARLETEMPSQLRAEIDELRVDSRRIAELYDLVFERLAQRERGDRSSARCRPDPHVDYLAGEIGLEHPKRRQRRRTRGRAAIRPAHRRTPSCAWACACVAD